MKRNLRVLLFAIVLSSAHINYGYSISYSGNAQVVFKELNYVNEDNAFLYTSILNLGSLVGCFTSGFIAMDLIGRKRTILVSSIFYMIGWTLTLLVGLKLFDLNYVYYVLVVGRLITGIGLGFASCCIQVYLSECLSIRFRNRYSIFPATAISTGIFCNYVLGYFMLRYDYDVTNSPSNSFDFNMSLIVMPSVGLFFAVFEFVSSFFMPESITFMSIKLKKQSKNDTTQNVMGYSEHNMAKLIKLINTLYPDFNESNFHTYAKHTEILLSQQDYTSTSQLAPTTVNLKDMPPIKFEQESDQNAAKKIKNLFKRQTILPLGIGVMLMLMQQFFGVTAILYNSTSIFASAGFGTSSNKADAALGSVAIGVVSITCVFIGMAVVKYMKRKQGFIIGAGLLSVPLFILGVYYQYDLSKHSWLAVLCVVLFFVFFNASWASLPWIFMSEAIHGMSKSYAVGIVSLSNWLIGFTVTSCFPYLATVIDYYGVMYLFGSICLVSTGIIYLLVPETKGKTAEQMEHLFRNKMLFI